MTQLKKCKACEADKELSCFHDSKDGLYGVKNICKECKKNLAEQSYINNKDHILEQKQEYYNANAAEIIKKNTQHRINRTNKQNNTYYGIEGLQKMSKRKDNRRVS